MVSFRPQVATDELRHKGRKGKAEGQGPTSCRPPAQATWPPFAAHFLHFGDRPDAQPFPPARLRGKEREASLFSPGAAMVTGWQSTGDPVANQFY
jgi:hypothetical protein